MGFDCIECGEREVWLGECYAVRHLCQDCERKIIQSHFGILQWHGIDRTQDCVNYTPNKIQIG